MKNKTCYICLPISNHEDTLFERAEKASEEVRKLGYKPVTPMEINNETPETIYDHSNRGFEELGNDITALLECDAIYCCAGFVNSKGCMTEYHCAKIYGKKIIYQFCNPEETIIHNLTKEYEKLVLLYNEANRVFNKDDISLYKKRIANFLQYVKENYNLEFKLDKFIESSICRN